VILDLPGNLAGRGKVISPKILPTLKGYTVDLRRQQFRRTRPGPKCEVIHFLSHKGWKLFDALGEFVQEVVEFYHYK